MKEEQLYIGHLQESLRGARRWMVSGHLAALITAYLLVSDQERITVDGLSFTHVLVCLSGAITLSTLLLVVSGTVCHYYLSRARQIQTILLSLGTSFSVIHAAALVPSVLLLRDFMGTLALAVLPICVLSTGPEVAYMLVHGTPGAPHSIPGLVAASLSLPLTFAHFRTRSVMRRYESACDLDD